MSRLLSRRTLGKDIIDHGDDVSGLTDDDHTDYRLESADHSHLTAGLQGGLVPGADSTASHDDVAGEGAAIIEKVTPVDADVTIIEDLTTDRVRCSCTEVRGGSDTSCCLQYFAWSRDVWRNSAAAIHDFGQRSTRSQRSNQPIPEWIADSDYFSV